MGFVLRHRAGRRAPQSFREADGWVDREIAGCEFGDARLGDRFRKLVAQLGSAMGQSIPLVCQDWANTKAAYRFFSNERVSEADILAGHFQSTRDRTAATDGLVLVLHDTTEFSYTRENSEAIGITAPPDLALTAAEIGLLDHLVKDKDRQSLQRKTLSHYLTKIARLGGYLARANDPPPGNTVMWRGLSRLTDIELGAIIGTKIVGN